MTYAGGFAWKSLWCMASLPAEALDAMIQVETIPITSIIALIAKIPIVPLHMAPLRRMIRMTSLLTLSASLIQMGLLLGMQETNQHFHDSSLQSYQSPSLHYATSTRIHCFLTDGQARRDVPLAFCDTLLQATSGSQTCVEFLQRDFRTHNVNTYESFLSLYTNENERSVADSLKDIGPRISRVATPLAVVGTGIFLTGVTLSSVLAAPLAIGAAAFASMTSSDASDYVTSILVANVGTTAFERSYAYQQVHSNDTSRFVGRNGDESHDSLLQRRFDNGNIFVRNQRAQHWQRFNIQLLPWLPWGGSLVDRVSAFVDLCARLDQSTPQYQHMRILHHEDAIVSRTTNMFRIVENGVESINAMVPSILFGSVATHMYSIGLSYGSTYSMSHLLLLAGSFFACIHRPSAKTILHALGLRYRYESSKALQLHDTKYDTKKDDSYVFRSYWNQMYQNALYEYFTSDKWMESEICQLTSNTLKYHHLNVSTDHSIQPFTTSNKIQMTSTYGMTYFNFKQYFTHFFQTIPTKHIKRRIEPFALLALLCA